MGARDDRSRDLPRIKLVRGVDVPFFGLQSVLYGFMGGLAVFLLLPIMLVVSKEVPVKGVLLACAIVAALTTIVRLKQTVFSRLTIGDDGIRLSGVLKERFVPFREVESFRVEQAPNGASMVALALSKGKTARVRIDTMEPEHQKKLLAKLEHQVAAFREAARREVLSVLERSDRTVAAWRGAIEELWNADYRRKALQLEAVKETLSNPAATAEQRIGAALALMTSTEPDASQTIAEQASRCAEPALRAALDVLSTNPNGLEVEHRIDDALRSDVVPSEGVRIEPVLDASSTHESDAEAEVEAQAERELESRDRAAEP